MLTTNAADHFIHNKKNMFLSFTYSEIKALPKSKVMLQ